MALVYDDEVKEISRKFLEESRALLVPRDCLVGSEVHLATFHCLSRNLPACVSKRSECLVLRVVNEDVSVGEIEDSWPSVFANAIPSRVPELVTDLKGNDRLARARGKGQEN